MVDGDSEASNVKQETDVCAETDSDDDAKRKLKRQRRQRTHFTSQQLQGKLHSDTHPSYHKSKTRLLQ